MSRPPSLASQEHHAKKQFGQNFLHDPGIIQRILRTVAARPTDRVVEVGPGHGALTTGLMELAGSLTAIEIDRDLHRALQDRFGDRLQLLAQDVLTVDFGALADAAGQKLRIVGNLPYNISSPILFHLLQWASRIEDQTVMLQREFVDRMVASPGSKVYGRLSVMLQARYTLEKALRVPGGAFRPAPKVESAVVQMWPLPEESLGIEDWSCLEKVVTAAFSTRRKMLRNTLAPYLEALDLEAAGVSATQRAEEVSVAAYIDLANQLASSMRTRRSSDFALS